MFREHNSTPWISCVVLMGVLDNVLIWAIISLWLGGYWHHLTWAVTFIVFSVSPFPVFIFLFFISFFSHLHFSVESRSWNIYLYSHKNNLSHSAAILAYIVIFHWTLSLFHGFVQRNLNPSWEMSVCHNLVNPKHTWLVLIFDELLSIPRWTYNSP